MTFALYTATALLSLWLIHRFLRPLSPAAALLLFIVPLAITGHAVFTNGVYGPLEYTYASEPLRALKPQYGIGDPYLAAVSDVYAQMFPWRRAVQASLGRGEWPLWNPYLLCGHLLAGSLQSAPYSPITLLACLLPAAVSFTFTSAIGLLLAAAGAFLLARELECGEPAALLAAVGWSFASSTILYIHTAMGLTLVYIPLLFMAAGRIARAPGLGSAVRLAIVLALMFFAGHPETLFLAVLGGCAYGIFEMWRSRAKAWHTVVAAIAAGIVALLLCAIQLLPFAEGMAQSAELEIKTKYWSQESRAATGDRVLALFATDLLPYLHVRNWVQPSYGWNQAETAACGSIILALAAYAFWRRRSAETWFFSLLGIVCVVIANRWKPAVDAVQKIPLLNFTHHERLAFVAALCLAILAALGFDHLLRHRDFRAAAVTFAAILIALTAGTLWTTQHVVLAPVASDWSDFKIFAELFFLGAAALLLALLPRPRALVPALLSLLVLQRVMSEGKTFRTWPAAAAYPRVGIFEPLKNIREPFRIVGPYYSFIPSTAAFYGLEDVRGYDGLTYMPFVHTWRLWCTHQPAFFNRVDDLTKPFLSFLNVRFAVASDEEPVPEGWRKIAQQRGSALLENTRVLDRVFVPRRVRFGPSVEKQVGEMAAQTDFHERAWILGPDAYERDNGPGAVTLRSHSPGGRYRFDADMQGDGWIVLSDTAWKGWRAYLDGRRVKMQQANGGFLAVHVPQGRHALRAVYWPESFVRGRAITFATLLGLIAFAIVRWIRAARRTPRACASRSCDSDARRRG